MLTDSGVCGSVNEPLVIQKCEQLFHFLHNSHCFHFLTGSVDPEAKDTSADPDTPDVTSATGQGESGEQTSKSIQTPMAGGMYNNCFEC